MQFQKQPPEVFCKKRCSQKFRKILRPACNFIKKETLAQVFSCEFLRTPFLQNTFGRLLLQSILCHSQVTINSFFCFQTFAKIVLAFHVLMIWKCALPTQILSDVQSLISKCIKRNFVNKGKVSSKSTKVFKKQCLKTKMKAKRKSPEAVVRM